MESLRSIDLKHLVMLDGRVALLVPTPWSLSMCVSPYDAGATRGVDGQSAQERIRRATAHEAVSGFHMAGVIVSNGSVTNGLRVVQAGAGEHADVARYDIDWYKGGFGYREYQAALEQSLSAPRILPWRDGHAAHALRRK